MDIGGVERSGVIVQQLIMKKIKIRPRVKSGHRDYCNAALEPRSDARLLLTMKQAGIQTKVTCRYLAQVYDITEYILDFYSGLSSKRLLFR